MAEIGNIEINFQVIDSGDPKTLLVADFSSWKVIKELPSYIEITLPGARNPVITSFNKQKINGFNSLSLGTSTHINCTENFQDLPDGIYNICVKGGRDGQHSFHRYYLKKDKFQNDLDEVWIKLDLDYSVFNKELRESLLIIEGLLRAASAATRKGFIPQAKNFFNLAKGRLDAHKECKNCI
jgi:hypothetical protein